MSINHLIVHWSIHICDRVLYIIEQLMMTEKTFSVQLSIDICSNNDKLDQPILTEHCSLVWAFRLPLHYGTVTVGSAAWVKSCFARLSIILWPWI